MAGGCVASFITIGDILLTGPLVGDRSPNAGQEFVRGQQGLKYFAGYGRAGGGGLQERGEFAQPFLADPLDSRSADGRLGIGEEL
jgi:hypothetical protein